MADPADDLYVKISLDDSQYSAGLRASVRQAKTASSRIRSSFASAGAAISKATSAVARMTVRLGGMAAGFISVAKALKAMQDIDELAKTSDRLGIAIEQLRGLQFAADQTGVSTNTLNMALQRMTRRVAEAAQGMGEAQGALRELGLDATTLSRMSPDQSFREIATAMEGVGTQADRVRLAMKLFDSEGVALVNTMRGGAAALDEYQRRAEELGLTISRVDAAQIEAANDMFSQLGQTVDGVFQRLMVDLAPAFAYLSDQIIQATSGIGGLGEESQGAGRTLAVVAELMSRLFSGLSVVFNGAKSIVIGLAAGIRELMDIISEAATLVEESFGFAWEQVSRLAKRAWAGILTGIADAIQSVGRMITHLPGVTQEMADSVLRASYRLRAQVAEDSDASADRYELNTERMAASMERLQGMLSGNTEAFSRETRNVLSVMEDADEDFQNAWNSMMSAGSFEQGFNEQLASFESYREQFLSAAQTLADERTSIEENQLSAEEQLRLRREELVKGHLERMAAEELDFNAKTEAIWRSGANGKMQLMSQFFGSMSALMNTENKKQFEIGKAAAIAGATVDTYLAATKAYQAMSGIPVVGPALGAAAAAAAVAAGVANINAIKSQKMGGGGGAPSAAPAASASAGAGAESAAGPQNVTQFNVAFTGEGPIGQDQVRGFIGLLQEQADDNNMVKVMA